MSEVLLIVDVQTGFLNQFTHHIPQRVAGYLECLNKRSKSTFIVLIIVSYLQIEFLEIGDNFVSPKR